MPGTTCPYVEAAAAVAAASAVMAEVAARLAAVAEQLAALETAEAPVHELRSA